MVNCGNVSTNSFVSSTNSLCCEDSLTCSFFSVYTVEVCRTKEKFGNLKGTVWILDVMWYDSLLANMAEFIETFKATMARNNKLIRYCYTCTSLLIQSPVGGIVFSSINHLLLKNYNSSWARAQSSLFFLEDLCVFSNNKIYWMVHSFSLPAYPFKAPGARSSMQWVRGRVHFSHQPGLVWALLPIWRSGRRTATKMSPATKKLFPHRPPF